jgi:hypothetical protein
MLPARSRWPSLLNGPRPAHFACTILRPRKRGLTCHGGKRGAKKGLFLSYIYKILLLLNRFNKHLFYIMSLSALLCVTRSVFDPLFLSPVVFSLRGCPFSYEVAREVAKCDILPS